MGRLHVTETSWQQTVTETAETFGWRWLHMRPARLADGQWRTPVSGSHAKGWPDLILVRDRLIVAELKGTGGKLTAEQADWLAALTGAGVEAYCWGPDDWPQVQRVLSRRSADAA